MHAEAEPWSFFCYLYALAAAGQAGVERALSKYKAELERDMKLMGCTKISDLNRNNLRFR